MTQQLTSRSQARFNIGAAFMNDIARLAAENAVNKGFNDVVFEHDETHLILALALITSEVSEALKVFQDPYDDTLPVTCGMTLNQLADFNNELADIVIRTFHLAAKLNLPIGDAIVKKMEKNTTRPFLHGKRF